MPIATPTIAACIPKCPELLEAVPTPDCPYERTEHQQRDFPTGVDHAWSPNGDGPEREQHLSAHPHHPQRDRAGG
jgi:hypothetical protein